MGKPFNYKYNIRTTLIYSAAREMLYVRTASHHYWSCDAHLIFYKLGGVLQVHLLLLHRCVAGGQCQTAKGVAPSAPLLNDGQDVVFDWASQGHTVGAHTNVCATVNDTLWSTLMTQLTQHTTLLTTFSIALLQCHIIRLTLTPLRCFFSN